MPIEFRCSNCRSWLQVPDGVAGRQAKCPACGHVMPVPESFPPVLGEPGGSGVPPSVPAPSPGVASHKAPSAESVSGSAIASDVSGIRPPMVAPQKPGIIGQECKNHPGVNAVNRCTGCAEPFCENCLVTIHGQPYCGSCKVMAIQGLPPIGVGPRRPCKEAGEALTYAIIGLFCCGIVFEPLAIGKALEAKRKIAANPQLTGAGKAQAALVVAIIALVLWGLGILARFAELSRM